MSDVLYCYICTVTALHFIGNSEDCFPTSFDEYPHTRNAHGSGQTAFVPGDMRVKSILDSECHDVRPELTNSSGMSFQNRECYKSVRGENVNATQCL